MPRATREFEEVARKYVLSRIQKDIQMDANGIKQRDTSNIGIDF